MAQKSKALIAVELIIVVVTSFAILQEAAAKTQVGPMSFDEPSGFSCRQEDLQTVCTDPNEATPKNAVVLSTLKIRGPEDTLENFTKEISQPRMVESDNGRILSRVISVGEREINGWPWISAVHRDSEVPGYVTHYYATVTDGYAVLMTYSIVVGDYEKRKADFEAVALSMKIESNTASGSNSAADQSMEPVAMPKRKKNMIILGICGILAVSALAYVALKK